jgi:hypothetical protein
MLPENLILDIFFRLLLDLRTKQAGHTRHLAAKFGQFDLRVRLLLVLGLRCFEFAFEHADLVRLLHIVQCQIRNLLSEVLIGDSLVVQLLLRALQVFHKVVNVLAEAPVDILGRFCSWLLGGVSQHL